MKKQKKSTKLTESPPAKTKAEKEELFGEEEVGRQSI